MILISFLQLHLHLDLHGHLHLQGNAIAFLSVACQEKSMAAICNCGTCKPSTLNNSLGEPRGCFSTLNRHE